MISHDLLVPMAHNAKKYASKTYNNTIQTQAPSQSSQDKSFILF